jgi:hypothetical protein
LSAAACVSVCADIQLTSLNNLVKSMAGSNDTKAYTALQNGYCRPQARFNPYVYVYRDDVATPDSFALNQTNPLQVNCSANQYITRVALAVAGIPGSWAGNGRLPLARSLPGLARLNTLECSDCSLDSTLPRDWGTSRNLMELRYLDLRGNAFTGTLPGESRGVRASRCSHDWLISPVPVAGVAG